MSKGLPGPVCALAGVGLTAVLAGAPPAAAHPHVWVTASVTFLFEGPEVVGLRQHWVFDTMFSSFVIGEHDKDANGAFNEAETRSLIDGAFSNLEAHAYFTMIRLDGVPQETSGFKEFAAHAADGALIYEFTLPLPKPANPASADLSVGVYDPDYYVEVLLDEKAPVRFEGSAGEACSYIIKEDEENPIYYGMVYPLAVRLTCASS